MHKFILIHPEQCDLEELPLMINNDYGTTSTFFKYIKYTLQHLSSGHWMEMQGFCGVARAFYWGGLGGMEFQNISALPPVCST